MNPREMQLAVYLIAEGWNDLKIARELDLEENTLKRVRAEDRVLQFG